MQGFVSGIIVIAMALCVILTVARLIKWLRNRKNPDSAERVQQEAVKRIIAREIAQMEMEKQGISPENPPADINKEKEDK